ncbi:MAG: alcohol dehydrogenase catalytic domain-containing protein [Candidatus Aureabacteria bacterium]|nr:alcohol dehydrogenase catalytic domain-containing protein [Candidatus Auribacterota bacterium]
MNALLFDGGLRFRNDYPEPACGKGESLVAISVAGICATDLEIVKGYMGFRGVPGHEFVGRVIQSGRPGLKGARVVGEINCSCGRCDLCRRGLQKHCRSRTVLGIQGRDGAFADYLSLPDDNLHILPGKISDQAAVFAEPLAAACQACDDAGVREGEEVAILGDGRLGLLTALAFLAHGTRVTLIGTHRQKLAIAGRAGARTVVSGEAGRGGPYDAVIEATGSPDGLAQALAMVRPRGRIVMKTTVACRHALSLASLVIDEVSLVGSRCGNFNAAIALLEQGRVDPEPMISARYPLSEGEAAFSRAGDHDALKVVFLNS